MTKRIYFQEVSGMPMKRRIFAVASNYALALLFVCSISILGTTAASAACHVITPGGSGTRSGADWSNAMAGLPSNLVRGDSYYVGPGNYGNFSHGEAASGTLPISIKRAFLSDHCTDTGYSDAALGRPGGQAVFTRIEVLTANWIIDGNYPDVKPANITDTGIYVDGTKCTSSNCWTVSLGQSDNTSNITVRNLSIQGGGDAKQSTNVDSNIRIIGGSNFLIQFVEIFNSSNSPILLRGVTGFTLDHSLLNHNVTNAAYHGEGISDGGSNNVTISFNTFKDIQGTGAIVNLNAGTPSTAANWNIYGNLFVYPPGNPSGRSGFGNGIIACINNQTATNWNFYNNTIAGMVGLSTRLDFTAGSGDCANPTGIVAYNNVWYNSARADHGGPVAQDYNTYIQMTNVTDTGAHTINSPSGANPFDSDVNGDYHLKSDSSLTPISLTGLAKSALGTVLGGDVDVDGVKRTTSRGAYQYVSGTSATAPAAPVLNPPVVQ
jgi:hypothetical protein